MDGFRYRGKKIKRFIREQGIYFYIPFLVNLIMIPMLIWNTYRAYGAVDETKMQIIRFSQYFIPLMILVWVLFSLVKYIDNDGNEIFFVTKPLKWKEVLTLYFLYMLLDTWPFFIYARIFDGMFLEWIRIAIEVFLFVSAAYCLAFLIKSIAITFVLTLVYGFVSVFMRGETPAVYFYYGQDVMTLQELTDKYFILLAAGILFFVFGVVLNKKMRKYL